MEAIGDAERQWQRGAEGSAVVEPSVDVCA